MASIAVVSPVRGQRVVGSVTIRVRVTGAAPSFVTIVIGAGAHGVRVAARNAAGEYTTTWDTTRKLFDRSPVPSDAMFWITASARLTDVELKAPYVNVITANKVQSGIPNGGWRPELGWAADYSGDFARWRSGHNAVIGGAYARLTDDPVLGAVRRVMQVTIPNSAKHDLDQPNSTTVRFQSSSRRNLVEGDEFCVGFAFMPAMDFPTVFPAGDPANPRGTAATGFVSLFQYYGPPYEQGSPLVIHANRSSQIQPLDELLIEGNELNPGDPWPFLSGPYNRGRWTDIVLRIKLSRSIEHGWIEAYVNQGQATSVQPVPFVNGLRRVPRVLVRAESQAFRTDMQVYRVADRVESVTVWHTAHRIARTVAEADPRSYRGAW